MLKKVLVASANPVKVNATREAFSHVFNADDISCKGISIHSEVPDQPVGVAQTLEGAQNRVANLKKVDQNADFFVGMEGGICYIGQKCYAFAWMFVEDKEGKKGQSMTGYFELPPDIVKHINSGLELGHANDKLFGSENSKQKGGAVGLLTGDIIDRTEYYVHAMILALIPFIRPKYY